MKYFRGRSFRSLDSKGRFTLSAEFRESLLARSPEGRFVLTTYDGCIVGYPLPEWEEFEEKFCRIPNPSRAMRDFRRLVIGGAEEQQTDAQGRVLLSRAHLEYAGLGKDLVLVGQLNRFELWDPARLEEAQSKDFDLVTQELSQSGIDFTL